MFLKTQEPFSFSRTLRFIISPPPRQDGRQFPPLLDYFVDGEYRRVTVIAGQPVLYGVSEMQQGSTQGLQVRILAGGRDPATKRALRSLVERQFSTALDLHPFYLLAESDRVLSKLVVHFVGMRIPQAITVYETLISAILEQQINLTFAHQVKKALIEAYGSHVEFRGCRYNAFPEPAALAVATPLELRRLQISGPKARYIIGISRLTLDGTLDLEGLRALEPDRVDMRLVELKGVGPWTAQYVLLRSLGHVDSVPAADVGLQKAIHDFYGLRSQPSAARVKKMARAWAGWRSYATFYLWLTYWEDAEWRKKFISELTSKRRRSPRSGHARSDES